MSEVQATPSIEERIQASMAPEEAPSEAPVEAPAGAEAEAPEAAPVAQEAEEVRAEPEEAQAEGEEHLEVETLAELAEHFNLEPADLYQLKIPVTLSDGSRGEVSIGEWKDGYRASQDAELATKRAAEQQAALEQRQQALEAEWNAKIHDAVATLDVANRTLGEEFNAIDWNTLRENDPAEWSARRQQFAERNAQLQQAKAEIASRMQQHEAEKQQAQQQQAAQFLEAEKAALAKALPEWADEATAKAERSALSEYLARTGFSSEEVAQVADHRLVVMARKAMLYDQQVKTADAAKKKIVRIGKKPMKPGARISKAEQQDDATRPLQDKLRKSGRWQDAAALLEARLQR